MTTVGASGRKHRRWRTPGTILTAFRCCGPEKALRSEHRQTWSHRGAHTLVLRPKTNSEPCIAQNPQLTPVSNTREKRPNQHHSGSINLCDNSKEAPQQSVRGALSLGCPLQFRSTTGSGTSKTQCDKEYGITSWTDALDFLKVKSLSRAWLFGLFGQREHIGKWKTALKWSLTRLRALFSNATASPSWSQGLGMGLRRVPLQRSEDGSAFQHHFINGTEIQM